MATVINTANYGLYELHARYNAKHKDLFNRCDKSKCPLPFNDARGSKLLLI